jgi:Ca-activated chloride channel family protein
MTEDELKALKGLPAPPPRAGAKAAALAAAMAAFDADAEAPEKKIADLTQGNEAGPRPMHASHGNRRQNMRAHILYKFAAGIAFILVATPTAVYFVNQRHSPGGHLVTGDYRGAQPLDKKFIDGLAGRASPEPSENAPAEKLIYERLGEASGSDGPAYQPSPDVSTRGRDDQISGIITPSGGTLEQRINQALREAKQEDPEPAPPPAVAQLSQPTEEAPSDATLRRDPTPTMTPPSDGKGRVGAIAGPSAAPQQNARVATAPATTQPEASRFAQPHAGAPLASSDFYATPKQDENRDKFEAPAPNPVKQAAAEPVSTFSIDVDTASYAFMRRALNAGRLPAKAAVRVEEMINYFPYDYPRPETAETPFQPTVTVVPAPWKPTNKLVHIGVRGYDIVARERPRANLVFLIDTSGSMAPQDRLALVKNAFRMLVDELQPDDTVGIVTYASGSGIALEPTKVSQKRKILAAIDGLRAGGSTAGAAGINDAYRLAEAHFDKEGVNRIILATDGDFNVGVSDPETLKTFVEGKRGGGIFLSILGVGQDNYNDALMQKLAQNGNGTAAYADTLNEARKVLVDEASSTLFTIAKDVKIQMEFNPAAVSEYRLIGYETRALAREDFNNDKIDAGDIGSGHTVTAIYEVTPVGAPGQVDDLRYAKAQAPAPEPASIAQQGELGFLKLRYKRPNEDVSKLISVAITPALEKPDIAAAPEDVRFSVAVAGFGQILRGSHYIGGWGFDDARSLALGARGPDPFGYRAEFLNLVRLAKSARP